MMKTIILNPFAEVFGKRIFLFDFSILFTLCIRLSGVNSHAIIIFNQGNKKVYNEHNGGIKI